MSITLSSNSLHFPNLVRKIKSSEAFTGEEFCELIGIDYQAIIKERKEQDQKENLNFFCNELMKITECRKIIEEVLQKKKNYE